VLTAFLTLIFSISDFNFSNSIVSTYEYLEISFNCLIAYVKEPFLTKFLILPSVNVK
jgi:hypothetical protein